MVSAMKPVDHDPSGGGAGAGRRVVAVLGPTNTGKTYLAIERMLGHRSGMIGFPLRLLARENYDRIVSARGARAVALITGEEMIVPPAPSFFVCTVEAMPVDRPVAFLAVDEIQLCADPERGHVFTDRLLHARGLEETMFLGSETVAPLIRKLVPRVEFVSRPRFSVLSYVGPRKLTRLPPRSAVVAFSATDVYSMAELIRRQRGGTAVVLGALSPRTRNAQVALYQGGCVDYLVATDAIGMGLNMEVDHVAFAGVSKFDGVAPRRLDAAEIAQIAGRAGRHRSDGTFGTTATLDGFDPELVEAVENHVFPPLKGLRWRNTELRFESPTALLKALDQRPPRPELLRGRDGDDYLALTALAHDPEIAALATSRETVRLLWEVCCIPDFRKVLSDAHTRLLGQIFRHLRGARGTLPDDWVAAQVSRLDRFDGDIDALVTRIAHVRTWTYISHRPYWLERAGHWQEYTRTIEDRLSDALHERLTQRFVDRRSALLVRSLKEGGELLAAVDNAGEVLVEGHVVGRLEGFRFVPDAAVHDEDGRALMSAARRALRDEISMRVRRLEACAAPPLTLNDDGVICWVGASVARLAPGPTVLAPLVVLLYDDLLDAGQRERLRRCLEGWLGTQIAGILAPLFRLRALEVPDGGQGGAVRGIAFQMVEAFGEVALGAVAGLLAGLDGDGRRHLSALGVRLGVARLYLPALLKPRAVAMRGLLYAVHRGLALPMAVPPSARVSVVFEPGMSAAFYAAIGFPVAGPRAIRADALDRFEAAVCAGDSGSACNLGRIIGCPEVEVPLVLAALGYRQIIGSDGVSHWRRTKPRSRRRQLPAAPDAGHPFAKLRDLERVR